MKTEISVIVPIYKVERDLPACIESVLNQTFTDFELILVDDGSPDGCGAICDEAAKKDARVRVIHQANQGPSAARNAGIEAARGAWLTFIDGDDFIAGDCLETLHEAAVREKADCALCGIQLTDEAGRPMASPIPMDVPDGTTTGQDVLRRLGETGNMPYIVAVDKLYRREIWQTLRYPVGRRNEDVFMFAKVFYAAEKVACIRRPMYFYRQRAGSIMHTEMTLRNLDEMWAFAACFDEFEAHGQAELMAIAEKRIFAKLTGVYYRLPKEMRHSEDMKRAKAAQGRAALRLMKRGKLSAVALLRTLAFHALPGLYGLRMGGKR